MNEKWICSSFYNGLYEVSDAGRVRRRLPGWNATYVGRFCKQHENHRGYYRVALCSNYKTKWFFVHKLVADAFIGPRPGGLHINHKDMNKKNNIPSNLEYVSPRQNSIHAISIRPPILPRGEDHHKTTLKNWQVMEILERGATAKELASFYGVSRSTIRNIRLKKTWGHLCA